jgi:cytosine/adenosine deaminase-related metal-dependent hydrolase
MRPTTRRYAATSASTGAPRSRSRGWLAGAGPAAAREAGRETWRLYGELAARRAVSLHELAERHLCWRDSVVEVIRAAAAALDVADEALSEALGAVQIGVELSFVGMCKSFDRERLRTDAELAASREELAYRAAHDELTGLPNRALIVDRDRPDACALRAQRRAGGCDVHRHRQLQDGQRHARACRRRRAATGAPNCCCRRPS